MPTRRGWIKKIQELNNSMIVPDKLPGLTDKSEEQFQRIVLMLEDRAKKFADGSLFVVTSPAKGVIWHDIPSSELPHIFLYLYDKVEKGKELCILERTKVFQPVPYNEDSPAIFVESLKQSGTLVEEGEPLFVMARCI